MSKSVSNAQLRAAFQSQGWEAALALAEADADAPQRDQHWFGRARRSHSMRRYNSARTSASAGGTASDIRAIYSAPDHALSRAITIERASNLPPVAPSGFTGEHYSHNVGRYAGA